MSSFDVSFLFAIALHAYSSPVFLFLILYVVPNWPLPNSSWKVKMSLMSEVVRPRTEPFFDLAPNGPLEWIFTDFCFHSRGR
jgi:hypothetical protein